MASTGKSSRVAVLVALKERCGHKIGFRHVSSFVFLAPGRVETVIWSGHPRTSRVLSLPNSLRTSTALYLLRLPYQETMWKVVAELVLRQPRFY